jgi:polar amino acid transport system permease protein
MDYVFQFGAVWKDVDLLLLGAWLTVKLSFLTLAIGLVVGTAGALARISRHRLLRGVARTYVEAIRNTPFLIQLLLLYLGLPAIGIRLAPEQAALLALVVNFGAYATEIIRAGIEAIPKGQVEAGRSLGLTGSQIFILIVMKPALRIVYPALSSQFILLVLTSSVVSVISAEELTAVADRIASRNFRTFEVYFIVTLMYLAFSIFFELASIGLQKLLFRWQERT